MKSLIAWVLLLSAVNIFAQTESNGWLTKQRPGVDIQYQITDAPVLDSLQRHVAEARRTIEAFFTQPFSKRFAVVVFPNRSLLDEQWQQAWNAPGFKSECWMVASGVADRLDLLSPAVWKSEACEHNPADQEELQRLITHEMVHVYHGQQNPVPDFTGLDNLAWLIEGVATYVSGQLTEKRMSSVRQLVLANKAPQALAQFWSGKDRYGLAGSMVKLVDQKIGRQQLLTLLKETDQKIILDQIGLTETQLIEGWKKSVVD